MRRQTILPSLLLSLLIALTTSSAFARSHVTNCIDGEYFELNQNSLRLRCLAVPNSEVGGVRLFPSANIDEMSAFPNTTFVEVYVTTIEVSDGQQFLGGYGSDYNGNRVNLRVDTEDGTEWRHFIYILSQDAECTLIPRPSSEQGTLIPQSEMCSVKNAIHE